MINLSNDLKLGEYLKIPARTMFLTQVYGTVVGAFINYAVMISIVNTNREVLISSNGDASWSGATIQSYNTNATSWALAKYLYKWGKPYQLVPWGLLIGAGFVALHRVVYYVSNSPVNPTRVQALLTLSSQFKPKVGRFSVADLNMPQLLQYCGYIPYNQSQTCVLLMWVLAGFFVQFFLRNYHPRIFKDYAYLVMGAFDGGSLTILFILSFAVFGAGGPSIPFPTWWGNDVNGYYDHCPTGS